MGKITAEKNEYALMLGQRVFDDTPKEVWAAIAISYMSLGGDWPELAAVNMVSEWKKLQAAGIVWQSVPPHIVNVATSARRMLIDQGEGGMLGPDYDAGGCGDD